MAMATDLLAVGSQSHVNLLDPRMPQALIRAITSIDPGQVCVQSSIQISCSASIEC